MEDKKHKKFLHKKNVTFSALQQVPLHRLQHCHCAVQSAAHFHSVGFYENCSLSELLAGASDFEALHKQPSQSFQMSSNFT